MRYATFLTIELKHAFYTNGKSVDFRLIPSPECEKILASHKMRWREALSAWKVLTPLSDTAAKDEPAFALDKGTTLRFFLQINDPVALRITRFPDGFDPAKALCGEAFLYFCNAAGKDLTASVYRHMHSEAIEVVKPSSEEAFGLSGHPVSGLASEDFQIEGYNPGDKIIRYAPAEKKLWINTLAFEPGRKLQLHYSAVPDWSKQVFGLVDITIQTPLSLLHNYQLLLQARSARWKYYVAAEKPVAQLSIEDKNAGASQLQFQVVALPPDDPLGKFLRRKFPDAPTLALFESKTEVPFHESVSKDLRLIHDKKSLRLPIPSRDRNEQQIITFFDQ